MYEEHACSFACQGDNLYGVIAKPERYRRRGVLIAVGGPQYRAGSHRQFTLLARALAADGVAVMRFDYRGMGDSEGEPRDFEQIDEDLRCAIDHFMQALPELSEVAIWGLCDGASAALFYASRDKRVTGLALVNPWVRSDTGMAQTYLRHYYRERLLAPELWRKILRGRFGYLAALRSLFKTMKAARAPASLSLPDRMLEGYTGFKGKVLLILSGNDYTAKEFIDLAAASAKWRGLLAERRTQRIDLDGANHTFSNAAARRQVIECTRTWLASW